jgi:hypothetical protein
MDYLSEFTNIHIHIQTKPSSLTKETGCCKAPGAAAISFVIPNFVGII